MDEFEKQMRWVRISWAISGALSAGMFVLVIWVILKLLQHFGVI